MYKLHNSYFVIFGNYSYSGLLHVDGWRGGTTTDRRRFVTRRRAMERGKQRGAARGNPRRNARRACVDTKGDKKTGTTTLDTHDAPSAVVDI